jgi:nanoRNase/pAp phosphatase (c-di-AMP/oligoRNAs hydrolase)
MIHQKFDNFISFLKNKRIIITTHILVDLDGFASSYALRYLLNLILPNAFIEIFFSDISKPVKEFIEKFSLKFKDFNFIHKTKINCSDADVIVILDTNNLDLVEFNPQFNIKKASIPTVFIDHHLDLNKEYRNNKSFIDLIFENFTSTSEIIYELSKFYQLKFPSSYKTLLVAAILTDSGFFKYCNNLTLQRTSELLDNQVDIQEIQNLLAYKIGISERIAKIKGLKRVRLKKLGNYLVGISNVSSFGASVASMLINIGFDIAIVYSKEKNDFKITTRATNDLCSEKGLHLGRILSEVSEGSGGGHDGAASVNGILNLEKIIKEILDNINQILIIS